MLKQDTLWEGGYSFYFDDGLFQPSTDSFFLSAFPKLKSGEKVCDLGCGSGLLGLLLLARENRLHITGVDIQQEPLALARRAAEENGLAEKLTFLQSDLRHLKGVLEANSFDLVLSNPPYFRAGSGYAASGTSRQTAREENTCTIEDVCAAAARLLRFGGRFAVVFRPERMADLFCAMRNVKLEPKTLRFVHHRPDSTPSLILVEGKLGGKSGLTIAPPLILHDAEGNPGEEMNEIYFRTRS